GVWAYWELAEESVLAAKRRWPGASAVIRVLALVPSWDGARRVERDVEVDRAQGSVRLASFGEGAVIRAALGFRVDDRFHPIAVGTELAPPNGRDGEGRVRWAPSPRRSLDPQVRDRAIERFA